MKRLIISLIILISGCSSSRNLIESQFNYKGHFKEYQSFGFVNPKSMLVNGLDVYDNVVIQSIIYKRFTAMGYAYDAAKPDILITFRYFPEGTSLVTLSQKNLKSWINSANKEDDQYLLRRVINNNGTLSVYFIDRASSNIIFQGFYKDYQKDSDSDYQIISSIGQLLDKYQVTTY